MAASKKTELPEDSALLEELKAQFFANLSLQIANGKETEEKFDVLDRGKRAKIKSTSKKKFGGFTAAQAAKFSQMRKEK